MTVLQVLDNFLPSFVLGVTPLNAMYYEMLFAWIEYPTVTACEAPRLSIPVTNCHTSVGIFMLFFMLLPIEVILVGTLADGTRVRAERRMRDLCVGSTSSMLLAQSDLLAGTRYRALQSSRGCKNGVKTRLM